MQIKFQAAWSGSSGRLGRQIAMKLRWAVWDYGEYAASHE